MIENIEESDVQMSMYYVTIPKKISSIIRSVDAFSIRLKLYACQDVAFGKQSELSTPLTILSYAYTWKDHQVALYYRACVCMLNLYQMAMPREL